VPTLAADEAGIVPQPGRAGVMAGHRTSAQMPFGAGGEHWMKRARRTRGHELRGAEVLAGNGYWRAMMAPNRPRPIVPRSPGVSAPGISGDCRTTSRYRR